MFSLLSIYYPSLRNLLFIEYQYSIVLSLSEIVIRGRSYSYSNRRSPLRYSQSPHYDRKYSRSPEYYSPARSRRYSRWMVIICILFASMIQLKKERARVVCSNLSFMWSRSISPRDRRYREHSYSRSPYNSRGRSYSRSRSRSYSRSYSRWVKILGNFKKPPEFSEDPETMMLWC